MRIQRFSRASLCVLLMSATFFVHGCGGSHKTSESDKVYPLSSQTRILQPGDTWTYSDGESVTINRSTLKGAPSLTRTTRYVGPDGSFGYTVKYFFQNSAGEIVYIGQRGVNNSAQPPDDPTREEQEARSPQAVLFGSWAQGATLDFKLLYGADAIYPQAGEGANITVVGAEKIKTALGTFDTWKVQSNPNVATTPLEVTGTYWYAPQLGTYVRAHETIGGADPEIGGAYDRTIISTNVPLGTPATAP